VRKQRYAIGRYSTVFSTCHTKRRNIETSRPFNELPNVKPPSLSLSLARARARGFHKNEILEARYTDENSSPRSNLREESAWMKPPAELTFFSARTDLAIRGFARFRDADNSAARDKADRIASDDYRARQGRPIDHRHRRR